MGRRISPAQTQLKRNSSGIIGHVAPHGPRRGTDVTEPQLSADDIATHLGITKGAVYTWVAEKRMPAHKIGRLWKFQATEVCGWVGGGAAGNMSDGVKG